MDMRNYEDIDLCLDCNNPLDCPDDAKTIQETTADGQACVVCPKFVSYKGEQGVKGLDQ